MEHSKNFKLIEDSDDEELPDIFNNNNEIDSENKNEISRGDIVWAKYRRLYWPALVRCVYKKGKEFSIWYLDSPSKTFKVSLKKLKTFSNPKENTVIREEVQNSPMKSMHTKLWLNALTYIRRQAEGCNDDPAAYFDLNQHYFSSKDSKKHATRYDETNAEDSLANEMISEDFEEESLVSSEDEENAGFDKKISIFWDLDDSCEDEAKTDAIVECITTGKVDKHLIRIKNRKIASKYQEIFDDAMKTDRKKLFGITACDVIKNLKKLKKISFYLMDLYEKTVAGGKCEMLDYVTSVWLPEAINQASILLEGGISSKDVPALKRKLFSSSDSIKEDKSDLTDQSATVYENKVQNGTSCKNIRRQPRRNVKSISYSADVFPVKSPRKKYKRR